MIIRNNEKIFKIYDGEKLVDRIFKGVTKVYEYLPVGYKECEYISSTGTQWIDTGVSLRNVTINITFRFNMATSTSQILLNCTPSTAGWFGLMSARKISLDGKNFDVVYNDKHNFILKYNNGIVTATDENGTIKQSTYSTSAIGNFILFNEWDSRKRFPSYARLYSVKVYEGNNIIRNFIPCLDNNDVPCLYDKATKTTFYNQGTGNFEYSLI